MVILPNSGPLKKSVFKQVAAKKHQGFDIYQVILARRDGEFFDQAVTWCEERFGLSWKSSDRWYKIDEKFYFARYDDAKDFYNTWGIYENQPIETYDS